MSPPLRQKVPSLERFIALAEPLFGFAASRCRDREAALDAVQEALAAAVREHNGGRQWADDEAMWAWLVAVTRNKLIDISRKAGRHAVTLTSLGVRAEDLRPSFLVGDAMPEDVLMKTEVRAVCAAALDELAPRQREALLAFYREGLSHAAIGVRMQLGTKAVESLLARARIALHAVLRRMVQSPEELL
ncbi:MAG: sigma-70 family RNA polymerase sigma factor [Planctomycetes bacterium]|nr:sigma-70 family RNA polymerase sigma factor [Planctomycetota bacterium]